MGFFDCIIKIGSLSAASNALTREPELCRKMNIGHEIYTSCVLRTFSAHLFASTVVDFPKLTPPIAHT